MDGALLKRVMNDKKEDVIHSSAYAEAQNQGGIGSVSTQTFNQRREIDQNRSMINKYSDSKVATEAGKSSWEARRDAAQFGESDKDAGASPSNGLRGRLNTKDGDTGGAKVGDKSAGSGPSRMPTRINPGISR